MDNAFEHRQRAVTYNDCRLGEIICKTLPAQVQHQPCCSRKCALALRLRRQAGAMPDWIRLETVNDMSSPTTL